MTIPILSMKSKIKQIRNFMQNKDIDAWLIFDFEGCDPTGKVLLGDLTPHSRQYAVLITQEEPITIIKSMMESHELHGLDANLVVLDYRTQAQFREVVGATAKSFKTIAANFSPNAVTDFLPYGRMELFRSVLPYVQWVPGENLMQFIHSVLTKAQIASHDKAAQKCTHIMEQAFAFVAENLGKIKEKDVAIFIQNQFQEAGMVTDNIPMVAVQENCANPHYTPASITIKKNYLIMIDLWAKWEIYADITWMAYSGSSIPDEIQNAWNAVHLARKTATKAIKPGIPGSIPDEEARAILIDAGYEDAILHRTGHSIDTAAHGRGANLDCFEMPETRLLLPNLITSVEPAVYLRNRFGIRSEIDVVVTDTGHRVSTPPQENILLI